MMKRFADANAATIASAALLLALGVGCAEEVAPPEAQLAPVSTTRVIAVDFEERLEVTGSLEARNHTTVSAEVSGRVTEILVEEGVPVGVDQATMAIDPERHRLELETAKAQLARSQATFSRDRRQLSRVRKLHAQGAASQAQLDESSTAYQMSAAQVQADQARLGVAERAQRDASVIAPFDGVIGRRFVSLGQFVQLGEPMIEFVSLDPMELVFHVAEVDSGRVHVDQQLGVSVAPFPGEKFRARVDVVFPTIDPKSHTLRVKAVIENADGRLRPGLFARADLGVQVRRGVAMVPEASLLQRRDGTVVFVVEPDGSARRRVVTTGAFRDGLVEIRAGVAPGDMVITSGHADLVDGEQVAVVEDPSLAADVAGHGQRVNHP